MEAIMVAVLYRLLSIKEKNMLKLFWLSILCGVLVMEGRSNNVQIYKELHVTEVNAGVATLEFGLAWDNSWRDAFNWDAVWTFLKYKEVTTDKETHWEPLYPESSGYSTDKDYVCVPGMTDGKVAGLFVFRNNLSQGRSQLLCRLKWRLPSAYNGFTKEDFEERRIIFFIQGIEMVFLPYKAFSLGDGFSRNGFCKSEREPAIVDNEEGQVVNYWVDDLGESRNVSLGIDYPKGYRGVYMMKYELSQEQYVNFLNTLKRSEQEQLLPFLNGLNEGDFLFGEHSRVSYRNGIILARKPMNGKPVRFANNFKDDGIYDEIDDGQAIACNYLSPADLLGYCAWAGLRPMSELEYEKASRRLYPQEPEKGEYAWNNSELPVFARSISIEGRRSEKPGLGSNVNGGGFLTGPVRCGSFATNAKGNQWLSGGSYWGIMELSGNLGELCYNVNAGSDFKGTVQGNGTFSLTLWPFEMNYFGVRGGSFFSDTEKFRTSDRSEVNYYLTRDFFFRDSTVGIRGIRLAETGNIDPGKIACLEGSVVCPGLLVNIANGLSASVQGMEGVPTEYMWYVDGVLVENEGDAALSYLLPDDLTGPRNIVFTRKAVTALGEGNISLTVRIPDVPFNSSYQLFEDPGSSIQISMSEDWKNNVKHTCWLEEAPSGLVVNASALISGLSANTLPLFKLKVAYESCPEHVYEKEIRIARNFNYTGNVTKILFEKGVYYVECWGGSGGKACVNKVYYGNVGKGGYAYGELTLPTTVNLFLYVGGVGGNATYSREGNGGFNGGGNGGGDTDGGSNNDSGGGGGGASDIRLEAGNWYSRIIVAGGGGACSGYNRWGGNGGGFSGGYGWNNLSSMAVSPGTQNCCSVGVGGRGTAGKGGGYVGGGGGGGGYFGGNGGGSLKLTSKRQGEGGGGGSGFVSGLSGCNAVDVSGNLTGQPNHYSGLIFREAGMRSGEWSGNGKIRIERRK